MAAAGVASRRDCEELILDGRVEVDRETVTVLGTRVDPQHQEIRLDGVVLSKPKQIHYVVNKPTGVVSTNSDPDGRPRVIDLVPDNKRLFTVGRLDRSSEGMIIVTNDGELANRLTHPRYGVSKTYRVKVMGSPTKETLDQLREGVHLAEGLARVHSLRVRGRHTGGVELEIVLTEGRNREIRRVLAKVGHKVQHLRRIAIGPVHMGRLAPGEYRVLTPDELRQLRRTVETVASGRAGEGISRGQRRAVSSRAKTARGSQAAARAGQKRSAKKGSGAGQGSRPAKTARSTKPESSWLDSDAGRAGTVLDYDRPAGSAGKTAKTSKGAKSAKGSKTQREVPRAPVPRAPGGRKTSRVRKVPKV